MLDLILAAVLAQTAAAPAADPCYLPGPVETVRPGCPRWRLVTRDARGARSFDPASGVADGGYIEVMTRNDVAAAIQGNAIVLARMRLDCQRRTFRVVHVIGYDAAGVRIMDEPVTVEARPVEPGHDSAALLAEFCPH